MKRYENVVCRLNEDNDFKKVITANGILLVKNQVESLFKQK